MSNKLWLLLLGIVLLGVALVIPSSKEVTEQGDTVTLDYELIREDGTVYYSSTGSEPLVITLGKGTVNAALQQNLLGMHLGESKTFTLSPEEAYGEYDPDLVATFDLSWLPEGVQPQVGQQLQAKLKDGSEALVTIRSFTDTTVTVDANHPLAGQSLMFQVELLKVEKGSALAVGKELGLNLFILILGIAVIVFFVFYPKKNIRPAMRRIIRPRPVR